MQLDQLISAIQATHEFTQGFAVQQVNSTLTIRNAIIGFYIVEYEQNGEDRAQYGTRLFKELAQRLKKIRGLSERNLYSCKELYLAYPLILQTLSAKFQLLDNQEHKLFLPIISRLESLVTDTSIEDALPPEILLSHLSFSHFVELLRADTPLKRAFYEIQAIKNNWGVRELERAISTLLFERTGLSTDKASLLSKVKGTKPLSPSDVMKNPVLLDFLGLQEKPEYSETDLEKYVRCVIQNSVFGVWLRTVFGYFVA